MIGKAVVHGAGVAGDGALVAEVVEQGALAGIGRDLLLDIALGAGEVLGVGFLVFLGHAHQHQQSRTDLTRHQRAHPHC